ncbi:D-alanyl-D-alanine carboxypeptidase/D-alanyl-D-alanine-endopeptidase, partial [Micromonospora inaquosa]
MPEAHLPRAPEPAGTAPETVSERPPPLPWGSPAGSASPTPNTGHFPVVGGERPVSGPPRGSARVPVSPAPVDPSFGSGPAVPGPGGVPPLGPPISALPAPAGAAPAPAPTPAPRRRGRLPLVLAAVLLLVLAGVGVVITRPGPVAGWLGDDAGTGSNAAGVTPDPAPAEVLAGP